MVKMSKAQKVLEECKNIEEASSKMSLHVDVKTLDLINRDKKKDLKPILDELIRQIKAGSTIVKI